MTTKQNPVTGWHILVVDNGFVFVGDVVNVAAPAMVFVVVVAAIFVKVTYQPLVIIKNANIFLCMCFSNSHFISYWC